MDINVFFQELGVAFASGDKQRISDFLAKSLATADAEKDFNAAVTILNEMTGFYRNISAHKAAIKAGEQAIAVLRSLGYENTVPFGTTLLNTGTAYRASGDNVRALELFTGALGILSHHLPEDDYQLAGVYNNASAIYEELGKYDEALENLEKAVAILEKQPGMEADTATVMTNLALVLLKLGRDEEATEKLETALAAFKGMRTAMSGPQYGAALAGMAEAFYRMSRHTEAANIYEAALQHIKSAVGENADYAFTLRNCAVVYEALGEHKKAEELMLKAHELLTVLGMETDIPAEPEPGEGEEEAPMQ